MRATKGSEIVNTRSSNLPRRCSYEKNFLRKGIKGLCCTQEPAMHFCEVVVFFINLPRERILILNGASRPFGTSGSRVIDKGISLILLMTSFP